ncbi:MAG: amidohydrolase family protein [Caulobacteraceae bacterium]|nr:amidohydrolase family protein [Caulobacteraceae bacterium]
MKTAKKAGGVVALMATCALGAMLDLSHAGRARAEGWTTPSVMSTASAAASGADEATLGPIDPATGLRNPPYPVNPEKPRYAYTGPTLIRKVRVIDGLGGAPREDQDVLVEAGRIAQIAPGGSIRPAADVKVIDGEGQTLLPGLMDLHVHFVGVDRLAGSLETDPAQRSDVYRYKSQLYAFLYSGVTTVLDCGTTPEVGVGLKRLINDGYVLGPRYFWSGQILEGGVEPSGPDHVMIPTTAQVPQVIDYMRSLNVDMIKLYRATPTYIIERATEYAHEHGLRVMIDAWERNDTGYIARYGRVDGFPHLNFHFRITDEDAKELADRGDFVFTTFYALNSFSGRIYEDHPDYLQSPLIKDVMPPEYVALMAAHPTDPMSDVREAVWHEVVEPVQDLMGFPAGTPHKAIFHDMSKIGGENLRKLLGAGVLVAAGTDAGEGESLLTELELIVADGGVTPVQAIEMATYNGARVLKKEKEFGSIQPNLIADLVLVKGDPSRNIRDVRNIEYVFKDGKIIDRASLTRQWAY